MSFLDGWRKKREAAAVQALKDREAARVRAEAQAAETRKLEQKKALDVAVTLAVTNRALDHVRSKYNLTDTDQKALLSSVTEFPLGMVQTVEHFNPSRLGIPCDFVAQILLFGSDVQRLSALVSQADNYASKDVLEALDPVMAVALTMVRALLQKPTGKSLLAGSELPQRLKELKTEELPRMTREELTSVRKSL